MDIGVELNQVIAQYGMEDATDQSRVSTVRSAADLDSRALCSSSNSLYKMFFARAYPFYVRIKSDGFVYALPMRLNQYLSYGSGGTENISDSVIDAWRKETGCASSSDVPEYGPCIARGVAGTCRNTADCTGYSTPGFCPGPTNIKCCTSTKPPAVSGGVGGGAANVPVLPSTRTETGKMPWEEPTVEEKTTSWGLVALVVGGAALAGALVWRYKKGGKKSRRRRSR